MTASRTLGPMGAEGGLVAGFVGGAPFDMVKGYGRVEAIGSPGGWARFATRVDVMAVVVVEDWVMG